MIPVISKSRGFKSRDLPDLATANDRALTDLCIPEYLYQPFKIY